MRHHPHQLPKYLILPPTPTAMKPKPTLVRIIDTTDGNEGKGVLQVKRLLVCICTHLKDATCYQGLNITHRVDCSTKMSSVVYQWVAGTTVADALLSRRRQNATVMVTYGFCLGPSERALAGCAPVGQSSLADMRNGTCKVGRLCEWVNLKVVLVRLVPVGF